MTHDLLQDLWLHQTTDVAVSAVTIHAKGPWAEWACARSPSTSPTPPDAATR
ncbi:hypothetical protein [Streptomyces sp. NPDC001123]